MKQRIPFLLLIAFSTLFLFSFYGKIIVHPDHYLFSNEGDAIKNYFTYCYHIKHDTSYVNFTGMNYPYGEHFLYTDCHPALSVLFKTMASMFSFFSNHAIGLLNFIMILSIFLTFFVCWFLLKELGVNSWFSLLFAIGITLLSPQIFRLGGHLALSYSVAIPLSWLLLIKAFKNNTKPVYFLLLFFNNLFWLFIHAYLGVIVLFFLAALAIVKYVSDANRRKATVHYLFIFGAIFLPIILFYTFTVFTDTHAGRTDNPFGFFLYNAEPDDVFLPNHAPLKPLLDLLTGNKIKQEWEAWSYVGLPTTLLFAYILITSLIKLFKRKRTTLLPLFFSKEILNSSLTAAFIVLLFAMAFPFRLFPGLLEVLPFLKQFRATGRFTWPFYFVATTFTAVATQELYVHAQKGNRKILLLSLCVVAGLLNIIEAIPYHTETALAIVRSKNLFRKEFLSDAYKAAIQKINREDYQAMLPLPFYYQGSESYSRPKQEETMRASMILSYHTGIPIICANLTRTSIRESKNIVQLVSPYLYKKEILSDLPNNRPFLVIRTKDNITDYEQAILNKCTPLYLGDEIAIYTLGKEDLFKNNAATVYNKYKQIKPKLFKKGNYYVTDSASFLYYNSFEELKSEKPFRGKGGFQGTKKGKNTFVEFAPHTFAAGKKYEVSIWMNNGFKDALNNWLRLIVEEYNEKENTWTSTTFLPEQSEVINGNWSLVEGTFEVKDPANKIYICTKGKDDSKQALFADDLLIRAGGLDVYKFDEKKKVLFYNNHEVVIP